MTTYAIPQPPQPSVAISGSTDRFPVRRIFCVGRNYAEHAREMGKDPDREPPFFFTKPADAVVDSGSTVAYPALTKNLHHEIELVVAIGKAGRDIAAESAAGHVWGYAVGLDLTRRDLQAQAKEMARPWDWSKAFDQSAPCGPLIAATGGTALASGAISLTVKGEVRQKGDVSDMIWNVTEIIAACSQAVELQPGDLIFTGTPAGVGKLVVGDTAVARIAGLPDLTITIGPAA